MGFIPGIKAFTAAVLGGIGNVRGAMLEVALGVVEAYGGDLLGASYIDVTAFLVLVLILLFRPSGLLGERLGRQHERPVVSRARARRAHPLPAC